MSAGEGRHLRWHLACVAEAVPLWNSTTDLFQVSIKIVPPWNRSQRGLWIIFSNQVRIFAVEFHKCTFFFFFLLLAAPQRKCRQVSWDWRGGRNVSTRRINSSAGRKLDVYFWFWCKLPLWTYLPERMIGGYGASMDHVMFLLVVSCHSVPYSAHKVNSLQLAHLCSIKTHRLSRTQTGGQKQFYSSMFFSQRTVPPYLRFQVENLAHGELREREREWLGPHGKGMERRMRKEIEMGGLRETWGGGRIKMSEMQPVSRWQACLPY